MQLQNYHPRPALVTPVTQVNWPKFPVIDAHNHMMFGHLQHLPARELLDHLDQARVRVYIDLDGGWGESILDEHLDQYKNYAPERFQVFGGVDWSKWPELGSRFVDYAVTRLRDQARRGAEGLKIWKPFGLNVRDDQGRLVDIDDARLDDLWAAAGELGLPVAIHVADPVAFFDPLDETNERWEELHEHPDWHFPNPPYPPFLHILEGLANLVAHHPETRFVAAHVGCYAENLAWVSALLDRCPNLAVDISARLAELGRQPYAARRFFLNYADRIVFGTDTGPSLEEYRIYYRFLETADEYFDYSPLAVPPQGRWQIYGIYLPDDVLAKVYYQNAQKIYKIGEIKE